jgi:GNAT superfamily N-acetyltransferase
VHEDPGLTWISTGTAIRFYNGVIRTRLEAVEADRVIEAVTALFRDRTWLMAWWVMPNSRPADLAERLVAHGFAPWDHDLGMAADLAAVPRTAPVPSGVTIERVLTDAALDDWIRTFGAGFGVPGAALAAYARLPRGTAPAASLFRYYLAWARGEPVGTALWFPATEAAVVDEIATIPAMRRRGVATAITHAALQDAREAGYGTAVLVASSAGTQVYRRLGFQSYGERRIYLRTGPSP